MKKIGFLFDMDGVIVDTNPTHKIALRQFCQAHGHDLSEQQLRDKIYGRTNKDWIPAVFGNISQQQVKAYADEKEALFRHLYISEIRPLDGLIEFLDKLRRDGLPCAIATSAPRENVDFVLEHTGIGRYFSTILDESFVTTGKPHPEIYLKTAAALGFAPNDCLVIEDSISGVHSGKAAGCKVLGITTTHTAEELFETDLSAPNFVGLEPQTLISSLF
jgi:HAD superfamily hydrolase (TIGR01509 family)